MNFFYLYYAALSQFEKYLYIYMRIWERIYFIMRFFNLFENWLIINVAKKMNRIECEKYLSYFLRILY